MNTASTNSTSEMRLGRAMAIWMNRMVLAHARHWIFDFFVLVGLYVGLPFLAPVFMKIGWVDAGNVIYFIYSLLCHQLPQRSFFLFGPKTMYSLAEVQAAWKNTNSMLILRQFVGNGAMGWKVAWSDRMVSLFTSFWLGGILYGLVGKRMKPISIWILALLAFPMLLDGGTHMLSDLAGIGQGFRDSNVWLAVLTNHSLAPTFYAGDALGSFNSWMRLFTGTILGLGFAWFSFPYMASSFEDSVHDIEEKFKRAGLPL